MYAGLEYRTEQQLNFNKLVWLLDEVGDDLFLFCQVHHHHGVGVMVMLINKDYLCPFKSF